MLGMNVVFAVAGVLAAVGAGAPEASDALARDKQRLQPLQPYVGAWRGVGQPKRGSNAGAWTEASEWSWQFADGRARLVQRAERGKIFQLLAIEPGNDEDMLVVLAYEQAPGEAGEAAPERFVGKLEDDTLVATAEDAAADRPARITIRLVAHGDRMLVLYEKRLGGDTYARLAEVGSTRKGSGFAKNAAAGPECVVTGGLGTIAVEHEGKTYYVCCGGCKELFDEDPAAVLAEYHERKAAERAAAEETR